jgi:uncharacterized protein
MASKRLGYAIALWALQLAAAHAQSRPSFDCARAGTGTEKLICSSPELSDLDARLSDAYSQARKTLSEPQQSALVQSQRAWMKARQEDCRDVSCLIGMYDKRLADIQHSPGPPGAAGAPTLSTAASPAPTYPRLATYSNAAAMGRVNALLAAQEKTDRAAKADCYAQLKEQKQKPDADSYAETIGASYESPRYLSVNVTASYWCGGPYPTNGAEAPLTFDLTSGAALDWSTAFKAGFLPSPNADDNAPPSALTKLYRERYRTGKKDKDDDCAKVITDDDPFSSNPIIWLDSRQGLIVKPDFPHVTDGCADELALTANDLAPYLVSAQLLADLKATVKTP